jgi:hypothetical protein
LTWGGSFTSEKKHYRKLPPFNDNVQAQNRKSLLSGWRVANLIQSPSGHRVLNIWFQTKSGEIMGRKPKTTGPRARDPGAFKSVLVRINADGWRALKMLAVENDTTLNALAVEAFNDLLKKRGKRQNVENPLLD